MKRPAFIGAFCCLILSAPLSSALADGEPSAAAGSEISATPQDAAPSSTESTPPAEASKTTESTTTAASESADTLERKRFLRALIPIALTLLGLIGVLVFYLRRRRTHDADTEQRHDPAQLAYLEAHAQPVYVEQHRAQAAYARGEFGAGNAALSSAPTPDAEHDTSIAFVAVDSEPYVHDDDEDELPPAYPVDALDTSVACMACDLCQKHFELGTTFCTHDGSILIRVDITDDEGDEDDDNPAEPSTPLLYCTRCTREAPVGEERCASCEGPLLFMLGRRTRGLTLSGTGERTHICPECRTQYDNTASFCGRDGSPLRPIN